MKAAIVFTDETEHWFARRLAPGFRHVFCVVPSPHVDGTSIIVNATANGIEVLPVAGVPDTVARHYRSLGLVAFTVEYTPEKRPLLPLTLNNCVGLTKQTVGISSLAFTPRQLWQTLKEQACVSTSHSPASVAGAAPLQPQPHPQRLHLHLPKSMRAKSLA